MLLNSFLCLTIFLFGLVVGSFLNCIIHRLETKESFLLAPLKSRRDFFSGLNRSYCPQCKHILNWQDLIPIFSFLILRGRCRYCQKKISRQYPIIEISTGLIFLLISNFQFPISNQFPIPNFQILNFFYYLLISCFLIVIFVYDLKHFIILDKVIYPAILIAFLYQLFRILNFEFILKFGFWNLDFKNLVSPLLSALFASLFFLVIVLISKGRWMGIGDIKLVAFMGLFLGFPNILFALFSAFFLGAIIGIGLIISGKKTLKSEIPFGPFLITGTLLALFSGEKIINWYLGLFL